jgi:ABC-type nitrate/sulfonate/bicarbonate transport system permease component
MSRRSVNRESASDRVRSGRVTVVLQRCALALLLLAAWWLGSLATPVYVLPSPERVFQRIVQLTQSGDLPYNLLTTLLRVLAGFARGADRRAGRSRARLEPHDRDLL